MSPIPGIIASSQTAATLSSYESIATATGTGSSGTITFSNIPSGYKSLQIRYIGKSTQTGSGTSYPLTIRLNSDTGSNYSWHRLSGNSSSATAAGGATQTSISSSSNVIPNSSTTAGLQNMHGVGIIDIIDYTSTSKAKTIRSFLGVDLNGSAAANANLSSGLWYATPAAITTIALIIGTGSWTTTSSFALYGIK